MLRLITTLILFGISSSIYAVDIKDDAIRNQALFGIQMPGCTRVYYAKESAVRSISMQEYITNGFNVLELNVATDGNGLLRIYHSRPLMPDELADISSAAASSLSGATLGGSQALPAGLDRLTQKAEDLTDSITGSTVIKDYPNATHAHTIEFRIHSSKELIELFEGMTKRWIREDDEKDGVEESSGRVTVRTGRKTLGGTLFEVEID